MASQVNSNKQLEKSSYLSFWNCSQKLKKENVQTHSMSPPSPWYQKLDKGAIKKTEEEKKITGQTQMPKSSTKD